MAKIDDMVSAGTPSTAVATTDEPAPFVPRQYAFGDAVEFDAEDVKHPLFKLAQGLSQAVNDGTARPGQYYATGYDSRAELTIIPMGLGKSRRYAVGSGDDYEVFCDSPDSKTGFPRTALPVASFGGRDMAYGGACASCPMSRPQPRPDDPEKRKVPCALTYSFIAYCVEVDRPIEVPFKGTAIPAAKELITHIDARGWLNFAVKLSAKQDKRGSFSYYVPVLSVVYKADTKPEWLDAAAERMPADAMTVDAADLID